MSAPAELRILESGPEALFRIGAVEYDGRTVTASMPVGPWLEDADGTIGLGSLGVLVDNVLGYALIAARPAGRWSVSTEIGMDLLEPLPADGTLHAEASVVHLDRIGGFASGRVTGSDGRVLAVTSQRGRFVPAPDEGFDALPYRLDPGSEDVVRWLAATYADGEPHLVEDLLGNPMGNVHGGMSLCLADVAARAAAPDRLDVASIHITYPRPIPLGSSLVVDPELRHAGRSLAVVEVTGEADGRTATVAQVVLQPPAETTKVRG